MRGREDTYKLDHRVSPYTMFCHRVRWFIQRCDQKRGVCFKYISQQRKSLSRLGAQHFTSYTKWKRIRSVSDLHKDESLSLSKVMAKVRRLLDSAFVPDLRDSLCRNMSEEYVKDYDDLKDAATAEISSFDSPYSSPGEIFETSIPSGGQRAVPLGMSSLDIATSKDRRACTPNKLTLEHEFMEQFHLLFSPWDSHTPVRHLVDPNWLF
ncbi:unnamed protein product [Lepeophtheirus salmonis]|uniref:(salmon louse) hypothetical protein n=1 Tax=Lepeophtheirus salmonis TaxID=72036 RepID=A0A7R8CTS7_LEPSM|nr:unnamed protein product [Lepeophtheirus salmonis]CAF2928860.1 unnamed protein product [Lepeophtheirus salmonis]